MKGIQRFCLLLPSGSAATVEHEGLAFMAKVTFEDGRAVSVRMLPKADRAAIRERIMGDFVDGLEIGNGEVRFPFRKGWNMEDIA